MSYDHLPRKLLLRELLTARPAHGPKLWWRDVVLKDIQKMGFDALSWLSAAQDCSRWLDSCQAILSGGVVSVGCLFVNTSFFICGCGRIFH